MKSPDKYDHNLNTKERCVCVSVCVCIHPPVCLSACIRLIVSVQDNDNTTEISNELIHLVSLKQNIQNCAFNKETRPMKNSKNNLVELGQQEEILLSGYIHLNAILCCWCFVVVVHSRRHTNECLRLMCVNHPSPTLATYINISYTVIGLYTD